MSLSFFIIWEPSWNFELHPLLNPWGSPVVIPLAITGVQVLSIAVLLLACSEADINNQQRPKYSVIPYVKAQVEINLYEHIRHLMYIYIKHDKHNMNIKTIQKCVVRTEPATAR